MIMLFNIRILRCVCVWVADDIDGQPPGGGAVHNALCLRTLELHLVAASGYFTAY